MKKIFPFLRLAFHYYKSVQVCLAKDQLINGVLLFRQNPGWGVETHDMLQPVRQRLKRLA